MAHAFAELDTIVVDDPDAAPVRPVVARTKSDGALTMQVLLDGFYHRRTPDLATTACGTPIPTQFAPLRREELAGNLCTECFTAFELVQAAAKNGRDQGDR
jgi:hypothetical protein